METTTSIWGAVEDNEVLLPMRSINQGLENGQWMAFERVSDDEDGTFPRISDYTRLANKIDNDGVSAFLTWQGGSKLKYDSGYCTVVRESKWDDEATLFFKEPITIQVAEVNGEPVTVQVDSIKGRFSCEWYWSKNGRQDKIANICEVYFDCQDLRLSKKEAA